MGDGSIAMLVAHCPLLRILSVKNCKQVGGGGRECRGEVTRVGIAVQLTEEGLVSLGQLAHLESLNAGQAGGVTDASVAAICAEGEGSRLKSLVSSR